MTNKDIQRILAELGLYKGAIDGDIGPLSRAALKAFHRSRGLPETEAADAATQAALRKGTAAGIKLDAISERNLKQVHPDLVKVVRRAAEITTLGFRVIEGPRTLARQRQLVAKGASQTLRSRHIPGGKLNVSHAVDIAAMVGGKIRWDFPLYTRLSVVMKQAAYDVDVSVEWGGDWQNFKDGPHYQLPWKLYPS